MICEHCKKGKLIEGTLEGVSFEPFSQSKKLLAKGIYGIQVFVCNNCGQLSDFKLNVEVLKKIVG